MVELIFKLFFLLLVNKVLVKFIQGKEEDRFIIKEMELDCNRLMCGEKSHCIYRKNWCRSPPCPSMVFCGGYNDDQGENLGMPSSCDKVRCSRSHRCIMRYVREQRTGLYTKTIARCVAETKSEAASCAGFKCPRSHQACMLREPIKCRVFPCRILRACIPEEEVDRLQELCGTMNCSSPDHCFLRRPYDCSVINGCSHRAGCLHSRGDDSLHDTCRGMICPYGGKCEPIYDHCSYSANLTLQLRSCKARASCNNSHEIGSERYQNSRDSPRWTNS